MSETSNASRKRSNTTADLDELNPGVQDMLNAPLGEEDEFGNGNQESGEETEDEDREVYTQDIASGEEDRGGSDRDAVGRKQNFRKFSLPSHEIILLEALDAVRPFGAQHGQTQAAWLRVVQYLNDHDVHLQQMNKPKMFEGVTLRACQTKWKALSVEYASHEAKMKRVTGAQLEVSERLELMQMIYEYEQECIARAKEIRKFKRRKVVQKESDRVIGQQMLDQSRTGLIRHRQNQGENVPQSATSVSGTESESSLSAISRTSRISNIKKNTLITTLLSRSADAVEVMKKQSEVQQKQLDFMLQDREDRIKNESERIIREDAFRREQATALERQSQALIEVIKTQTESAQRSAQQQIERDERMVRLQAENTERLVLAVVAALKEK